MNGQPVEDQGLVIDQLLVDRPGSSWTCEQLHKRLWSEAIVIEGALFQAVAKTRRALGESSCTPRWLATVAGQD